MKTTMSMLMSVLIQPTAMLWKGMMPVLDVESEGVVARLEYHRAEVKFALDCAFVDEGTREIESL